MKSIEERGQIAGQTYQFCKKEIEADHKIYEKGYIKGATEQKDIDTKEFMEESLKMLKEERERVKDEMIGKAIQYWDARLRELKQEIREGYDITRPKELIDFKKAMEE